MSVGRALARLNIPFTGGDAEPTLRAIVAVYPERPAEVRELFALYPEFGWAAHLPREWATADEFRARVVLFAARDQGADTRDEMLYLRDLLEQAARYDIDTAPILREVAALSSSVDRYDMGSTRDLLMRVA